MSQSRSGPREALETRTRRASKSAPDARGERVAALTIVGHPLAARIGDCATLFGLSAGEVVNLSRTAPGFSRPEGGASTPLADPFLSRSPLASLERRGAAVTLKLERADAHVVVGGHVVSREVTFSASDLDEGVVIELADRCALLLHNVDAVPGRKPPAFDLVGESDATRRLRRDIARLAATDLRVLIRGETGTGKELVARAIHAASSRATGPFVAVNMALVQPALAASALFGRVRGAFSGAVADHEGHMALAHKGTLFLDEIGDTDATVQGMLLRAIETGEVMRVGDRRARTVDVRLITATDADLETAVEQGRFREPLLHRISELSLRVPPLRERRDDIGRLAVSFLRDVLSADEQAKLLDAEIGEHPWLSSATLARLARAPWTGNVRQLRNVVRQLAVLCREESEFRLVPDVENALRTPPSVEKKTAADELLTTRALDPPAKEAPREKSKKPHEYTDEQILEALEKTGWKRAAAADLLGIARSSLYALIAEKKLVRTHDLARPDIERALQAHGGDLKKAAAELRVSEHGLKLRIQSLGGLGHS
ncbi:MAG: sigma-54-dependent Fis family transcriptional regulator [Polyangiaceae bacterium]|nr:sigma-54-dependent Fis family transcriptional regulator [Polyangiaceae bacterium]